MQKLGCGNMRSYGKRENVEDWLFDQLFMAYIEARKHKRHTRDEHQACTFGIGHVDQLLVNHVASFEAGDQ